MTLLKEAEIWWHNLTPKEKYMYSGNCGRYGLHRMQPQQINTMYYTYGIESNKTAADYITNKQFTEFAQKNNHINQHFVLATHNKDVLDAYQRMIYPDGKIEANPTIWNYSPENKL